MPIQNSVKRMKNHSFHLFDGPERKSFLPFTYIRPVAHIFIGMSNLQEKWEYALGENCGVFTQDYLNTKFPRTISDENTFINPAFIPNDYLASQILSLKPNQALVQSENLIAYKTSAQFPQMSLSGLDCVEVKEELIHLTNVTDLFRFNAQLIELDFIRLTRDEKSAEISNTNQLISPENIFIEEGANVEFATLNATDGPIYIAKNTIVMEGSLIRGGFYLGENAQVKMGAKIYGGTSVGPFSKVGGELNNVLFFGYSNKAHDGFLGNAVIGEWCNIGAATDASNLKNTFSKLRVWNYSTENFAKTDLQFCGLLMGDFSRCSIHTTFNTATTVGISANLFGVGFPRTFIPSFSYGGAQGLTTFDFDKAIEASKMMMDRRGKSLSKIDFEILKVIFEETSKWRKK